MVSLGWGLGSWKAEYKVSLPQLSEEEKELVLKASEAFRKETQRKDVTDEKEARQLSLDLLSDICDKDDLELESDQLDYLSKVVFLQTYGEGFLGELMTDQSLEEIALIGLNKPVFVYVRGQGWKRTNISVESQEYFISLVNRLGRNLGRRLTSQKPRLNAVLEDGSRMHASMPPVSSCELTIRKFGQEPLSPFDLLSLGTYDAATLALLSLAIQADLSVVFAGNTASGKTSTLNSLLSFVPSQERLLLIEETPEISLPHPHQMRLIPFEEGGISMVELVRDSLRMRPDRVAVGEVRGAEETRAFVESALSGQAKGCYTTFHAQTSRDAVLRMRMMGCLEADLEGIDLFVVQRRVSTYDSKKRKIGEKRCVTEIAVSNISDVLRPSAVFNGKSFLPSALSILIDKVATGTGLSRNEINNELQVREKFMRTNSGVKGLEKSFSTIQKFLYGGELL
ncbi:TPA: CpaF family protein [Candidatus Micrarchaeota archaeon]|nr:CpaF family protein [Candidatus Micrarchaeota archaeon]HIH30520.1 CpaF family protein [Candidatus Micrarchaeota archaeon]